MPQLQIDFSINIDSRNYGQLKHSMGGACPLCGARTIREFNGNRYRILRPNEIGTQMFCCKCEAFADFSIVPVDPKTMPWSR